jgi:hypothetical protein
MLKFNRALNTPAFANPAFRFSISQSRTIYLFRIAGFLLSTKGFCQYDDNFPNKSRNLVSKNAHRRLVSTSNQLAVLKLFENDYLLATKRGSFCFKFAVIFTISHIVCRHFLRPSICIAKTKHREATILT